MYKLARKKKYENVVETYHRKFSTKLSHNILLDIKSNHSSNASHIVSLYIYIHPST